MEYNISGLISTVHCITQSLQSKKYWKSYNPDVIIVDYTKIYVSSLLVFPSEELIFLTNNIFTTNELQAMTINA